LASRKRSFLDKQEMNAKKAVTHISKKQSPYDFTDIDKYVTAYILLPWYLF